MANIIQARKKSWSTPVIRKLRGTDADEARKLLMKQLEGGNRSAIRLLRPASR